MNAPIRTIDDLPQFYVLKMDALQSEEPSSVETMIVGRFDRTEGVSEGNCHMLTSDGEVLVGLFGMLTSLVTSEKTAVFRTSEEDIPPIVGRKLPYLHSPWKPHHIWMVDERWKWKRTIFQSSDAVSRRITADDVSIVEGKEVRCWIEIKKAGDTSGNSRYYPVFADGRVDLPGAQADGIIPGGWDHEHCEICNSNINVNAEGYLDLGEHWLCEPCYDKYVKNHDLSFLTP
ncbi:MAG TPA: hypothetical protein VMT28_14090 [Terriglobales bacterium]|jgi:hypothetical protein|nr:hypothetical protein [Terriglobales bacterium]